MRRRHSRRLRSAPVPGNVTLTTTLTVATTLATPQGTDPFTVVATSTDGAASPDPTVATNLVVGAPAPDGIVQRDPDVRHSVNDSRIHAHVFADDGHYACVRNAGLAKRAVHPIHPDRLHRAFRCCRYRPSWSHLDRSRRRDLRIHRDRSGFHSRATSFIWAKTSSLTSAPPHRPRPDREAWTAVAFAATNAGRTACQGSADLESATVTVAPSFRAWRWWRSREPRPVPQWGLQLVHGLHGRELGQREPEPQ